MPDPIISVEGISKRYRLRHQSAGYTTLRDSLTAWAKGLVGGRRADAAAAAADEEFWALKDVSFEIQRGEVVGIIGRNGAGKSTLLKVLSRITEPTSGRIRLRGRVASLLEVGTGFHPELSGRENIFLNGAILGMTKAEIKAKFDEIVAFSEVEKFLDTPVKHYSSGMYVRLAFAVAAHLDPEILIVDEVLAVGDAQFQKKCLGKMKDVATGGRTVLFVSHNMAAVGTLCSRAVLLKGGTVEKIDTVDNVVTYYIDTATARNETDIASMRLPGFGDAIRFVSLSLAEQEDLLHYNAPVRVDMTIQSDRDFEGLSIGASIFNHYGDTIGTLFTSDTFSIRRGETRMVRLVIDSPRLAPGNYYLGQSIGTGGIHSERFDHEIVIGAPAFTILPRGSAGMLATWHRTWGSVCFSETRLEPVDTPVMA